MPHRGGKLVARRTLIEISDHREPNTRDWETIRRMFVVNPDALRREDPQAFGALALMEQMDEFNSLPHPSLSVGEKGN